MKHHLFLAYSSLVAIAMLHPTTLYSQSSPNQPSQEKIAEFFKRFPEADGNKDGVLEMKEVRAFNQNRKRQAVDQTQKKRPILPDPTHAEVKYGDHERQVFDLWLAESKDGSPTPLVIYIHGGGFRGGSKASADPVAIQIYRDAGISFAAINYRLSDVGPYPIMMHDAARCLQTIRSRAKEWNLNPDKIACFGGSAGAGISLWLGFHDDLALPENEDPIARQSTRIVAAGTSNGQSTYDMRTFRQWFGVADLEPHPALTTFYAVKKKEDWESERVKKLMTDASAITHLTKDDVPVYMAYRSGNTPVNKETDAGAWVHHVQLGLRLQEAMAKLKLECNVASPDHPEEVYGSIEAFFIEKLSD